MCEGGSNSCVTQNPGTSGPKTTTVCNGNPFCSKKLPQSESYEAGYASGEIARSSLNAGCAATSDCAKPDHATMQKACTTAFEGQFLFNYDQRDFVQGCTDALAGKPDPGGN